MLKVSDIAVKLLNEDPFLESFLAEGLLNITALARKLGPQIEKELGKSVKESSIVMALKRHHSPQYFKYEKLRRTMKPVDDITVKSNLSNFTFENSDTMILKQKKLVDIIRNRRNIYYTWVQGISETNIMINSELSSDVLEIFKDEKLYTHEKKLSSITINLSNQHHKTPGIYFLIFKNISWKGINVNEVMSTTSEFTLIINNEDIDVVFSIIKNLNLRA